MSEKQQPQEVEVPPMSAGPWWAGLQPVAGLLLVAVGVVLLLWLVLSGESLGDGWASYYGAGRVLAIGAVCAGTTLLARWRGSR